VPADGEGDDVLTRHYKLISLIIERELSVAILRATQEQYRWLYVKCLSKHHIIVLLNVTTITIQMVR
jgi:hypothetical protein